MITTSAVSSRIDSAITTATKHHRHRCDAWRTTSANSNGVIDQRLGVEVGPADPLDRRVHQVDDARRPDPIHGRAKRSRAMR